MWPLIFSVVCNSISCVGSTWTISSNQVWLTFQKVEEQINQKNFKNSSITYHTNNPQKFFSIIKIWLIVKIKAKAWMVWNPVLWNLFSTILGTKSSVRNPCYVRNTVANPWSITTDNNSKRFHFRWLRFCGYIIPAELSAWYIGSSNYIFLIWYCHQIDVRS